MCLQHNCTGHRLEGPAAIILRSDRTHFLRVEHCVLDGCTVTATTDHGVRSWHMREIVEVRWREQQAKP